MSSTGARGLVVAGATAALLAATVAPTGAASGGADQRPGAGPPAARAAGVNTGFIAFTRGYDSNGDGVFGGGTREERTTDIYLKDMGSTAAAVRVHPANTAADITPSFSPDGTRLAWASSATPGGDFDILVKDLATGVISNLTNTAAVNERWPNWSADSSTIVYSRREGKENLDIWMMNADGTDQRYAAGTRGGGKFREDCCASFSPDGLAVVFGSNRAGNFDIYRYTLPVEAVDVAEDPARLTALTSAPAYEGTPAVEPSGSIVYRVGGRVHQAHRLGEVDGSWSSTQVTGVTGGGVRTPEASPDGTRLIYGWYAGPGTQLDIVIAHADGTNPVPVTRTPRIGETDPTWRPATPSPTDPPPAEP